MKNQSASQYTTREQLTNIITYHIAATIISDKEFPKKGYLPTLSAAPLRSLGHYVMLDYKLLLKIIWQVIDEIKDAIGRIYGSIRLKGVVTGVVTAIIIFIFMSGGDTTIALFFALIGGAVGFFMGMSNANSHMLIKEVATIRANAIKKLIAGEWTSNTNEKAISEIEEDLDTWEVGSGTLGGEKIPVLVITNDKQPFPGYGQLQAENVFVCRPQKSTAPKSSSLDIDFKTIQDNIMTAVSKFPVGDISYGDVLVIHGNSIPMDSPWLNENKAPKLWLDNKVSEKFSTIDKRVSIRRFFAVQTLFSEYGTVATFFIRPFMAGNSICCQIAFSTIGPLKYRADYFQKRILQYEDDEKNGYVVKTVPLKNNTKATSDSVRLLQNVRQLSGNLNDSFQSRLLDHKEIKKLDPHDKEDDDEYKKEFKELVEKSSIWLGDLILTPNWREIYSMTFTDDFFGKTETLSSVRTLYDQISRSILDTFDEFGFDISDYRDSEGNYSIHAEKIEQLVVGENIHVSEKKEDKTNMSQLKPTT